MKNLLLKLSAFAVAALVAQSAFADKKESKAESVTKATKSAVAGKLGGKLVAVKDGKLVDHKLSGSPEFYVFYHSASW